MARRARRPPERMSRERAAELLRSELETLERLLDGAQGKSRLVKMYLGDAIEAHRVAVEALEAPEKEEKR